MQANKRREALVTAFSSGSKPLSPCVQICQPLGRICIGCHRTIDEVRAWPRMSQEQRATRMRELDGSTSTHDCPACGQPAHCTLAAGGKASACWCTAVQPRELEDQRAESCLCRRCLTHLPLAQAAVQQC